LQPLIEFFSEETRIGSMKKTFFKFQKRHNSSLTLVVCFAIGILAGCAGGIKNQKLGMEQVKAKNYEEALKFFEVSRTEGNDRSEFFLQLAESKYQVASASYQQAQNPADAKDLPTIISVLSKAKKYAEEAIKDVSGIKDEDIKESDKKLEEKNNLLKQISEALDAKNLERDGLISQANALKEKAEKKTENAFLEFAPLLPFKSFLPEVSEAYTEISSLLINQLDTSGLSALDTFKTKIAKGLFEKLQKYFPEITKGQEGVIAVTAADFHKAKKFIEAYAATRELKKINPENAYLKKYGSVIRDGLMTSETKALSDIVKAKTNAAYMRAMDGYRALLLVEEITKEQVDGYNAEIKKLRAAIAGNFIKKAKDLAKSKESLPLVWIILKNVWRFDPEQAQAQSALAKEAFEFIQKKSALNSMLVVRSDGDPAQAVAANSPIELETHLKQQVISSSLQLPSWPAGVTMVLANDILPVEYVYALKKPQDLSKKPSAGAEKLNELDVILWANVLENKSEEYGANQVIYKVSRFVSSTRMVDNPEWFTAQQELTSAEQSYNSSYQQMQSLSNQCDSMGNVFAIGICKGAIQGISTSSVDSARAKYNATPRYLQENVNSDYTYRYYRVGLNLSMKIDLQYLDLVNKNNTPAKIIEYVVKNKEGDVFEGVMPSDLNGLRNGPVGVPELLAEKRQGQKTLLEQIQKELVDKFTREKGLRYCHKGEKMLRSSKQESSYLPAFQLCMLLTKNQQDIKEGQDAAELDVARKVLAKFYQFTDEEMQKYALSESELPAPTTDNLFTASFL